jgi:threonine/homoserine/homoserine lactone efflux protein
MDSTSLIAFLIVSTALLGSPGPAIAALVAIGRRKGALGTIPYYLGLQAGLALAAGAAAMGLSTFLELFPAAVAVMSFASTSYLLYVAYRVATAPLGNEAGDKVTATPHAGLLLGLTNPKAYLAFASLFGSTPIVLNSSSFDLFLKWAICVLVMIVVDAIWLLVGAAFHGRSLKPAAERSLNYTLAISIVVATAIALV